MLSMVSISDGAKRIILQDLEKLGGTNRFTLSRARWIEKNGRWQRNTNPHYTTYDDALAIERECASVQRVIPFTPTPQRPKRAPMRAGKGIDANEIRGAYQGATRAFMEGMKWSPATGRFIKETDIADSARVVVIGGAIAGTLFGHENPIGQEISIQNERFKVIGVMEGRARSIQSRQDPDQMVFLPLTTVQRRFSGNDHVDLMIIQTVNPERIPLAIEEVRRLMRRRHGEGEFYRFSTPSSEDMEFVTKSSYLLAVGLGGIAGFSLFVGGVGIMNIMLVTVTERANEIGLRKTVGARRNDILLQFLTEASALSVTGGVLGVALGLGLGGGTAKILSAPQIGGFIAALLGAQERWIAWPWSPSVLWMFVSVGISPAIGMFFGLYPAIRAARLTPIEALRR